MSAEVIESFNPNDPRTEGEELLLNLFKNSPRFDGWTIFEQPHINSLKPDFVLLHPKRGIIIIEVKDWNLSLDTYQNGGYIIGSDGRSRKKNPIAQVEKYKDIILKSELKNAVVLSEHYQKFYACIETVVYFHTSTKQQALNFCAGNCSYAKIWTEEDIAVLASEENTNLNPQQYTNALAKEQSIFNKNGILQELVEELSQHLQYSDYNYERMQPYILNTVQNRLAELKPMSIRRWSGVAGSGKSLVLAEKAVRALKDNKRVLVLTFNITLRHYLRDLCSQQFGIDGLDEERRKLRTDLTVTYFHGLLKTIMTEHEIEMQQENDDFTSNWIDAIERFVMYNNSLKKQFKYDYILIDEGQDFKSEWVLFLKRLFTEKGELLIVYDKAQDLYGRFEQGVWIEDSAQVQRIGFKGQPGCLKYSYRLPSNMVKKIHLIRQQLQIEAEEILIPNQEQINLLQNEFWCNYRSTRISAKLTQIGDHVRLLRETNDWEDITIITTNEHTGAEIVNYFENGGIRTSHVYDLQQQGDITRRRTEKWKFHGGTGRLKICSYQSYKGWETPNIILILDSPTTYYQGETICGDVANEKGVKDALFISMSRVKGKATTGEYSFTCLNYLPEYDYLQTVFGGSQI